MTEALAATRLGKRWMAVDYGRVRVGLATCDSLGIATTPLGHIRRESDAQAAQVVAAMAAKERVDGLVIGLPLHAGGAAGANVQWVKAFVRELAKHTALPVEMVDERYSSSEAEEALRERGQWPPANKGMVDAMAAAILLRRFLSGEQ